MADLVRRLRSWCRVWTFFARSTGYVDVGDDVERWLASAHSAVCCATAPFSLGFDGARPDTGAVVRACAVCGRFDLVRPPRNAGA